MNAKDVFDIESFKRDFIDHLAKVRPDLLKTVTDTQILSLVDKYKDQPSFQKKYLLPPETAIKNRIESVDKEINTVLGKHLRRSSMSLNVGGWGETSQEIDISSHYDDNTLSEVKGLLQQKRQLNSILSPTLDPGERNLVSRLANLSTSDDRTITRESIGTKGIIPNAMAGLSGTTLLGGSFGKHKPKSDEEVVMEVNDLRRTDPFFATVFPQEVKVLDRDLTDKVANTVGMVGGVAPEFYLTGLLVKGIGVMTGAMTALSKVPAAAKAINKLVTISEGTGLGARVAKGIIHGTENMPVFAAHAALTGNPETAPVSAAHGFAFGLGGGVFKGSSGFTAGQVASGMIGSGLGFAAPVFAIEMLEGQDIGEAGENLIANGLAGGILHAARYKSFGSFKKDYVENTGRDFEADFGKDAKKIASQILEGQRKYKEVEKWASITGLKAEDFLEKEAVKAEESINKPASPKVDTSIPEPDTRQRVYDPMVDVIDSKKETEFKKNGFGSVISFIDALSAHPDMTDKDRMDIQNSIGETVKNSTFVDDFVRDVKPSLAAVPNIDLEYLGMNDQKLRSIYHSYKDRAPAGKDNQMNNWVLNITGTNQRVTTLTDHNKQMGKSVGDIDFLSPVSDILKNNVSIISKIVKDGKDVSFSDLNELEASTAIGELQKKNGYLLGFKGDTGQPIVVKKHAAMSDPDVYKQSLIDLETAGVKTSDPDFAVNTHLYYKDILGQNYLEDIKGTKFSGNVQELIKRWPIAFAKGIKPESRAFDGLLESGMDGKAKIPTIIIPDSKLVQETDGDAVLHSEVFDRMMHTSGAENNEKSPIGNFKPFIFQQHEKLGTFMGKLKIGRATVEQDAMIEKITGGKGLVTYDSAAKYKGGRKIYDQSKGESPDDYRFDINPESIRVLKWEHNKFQDELGNPISGKVKLDRQIIYNVRNNFVKGYYDKAAGEFAAEINEAMSSPDKFKEFSKKVFRKLDEEDMDFEETQEIGNKEFTSMADKILSVYGFNKMSSMLPFAKDYFQKAVYNYAVRSIIQPKIDGGVFTVSGRPDWVKPILGDDRKNIVIGHNAASAKVDHLIKNGTLHVEVDGKLLTADQLKNQKVNGRKLLTIEDVFTANAGKKVGLLVGSDRTPIEDLGGIRAHKIVGIGPKGTGMSVYLHPEEMKFLGGADNDYDTMKIYFADGKDWHETLKNSSDYNKAANDDAERKVSSGEFSKEVYAKFLKDNPDQTKNSISKLEGISSLFDRNSMIKSAHSMSSASASIDKLMAFDRSLRTFIQRNPDKFPGQPGMDPIESYDAKMKYWKKATVDAKHGGLPPWQYVRKMIIDDIFGDKAKEIRNDPELKDISSMYSKVFSWNFNEGRSWSQDEVFNELDTYYKKYPDKQNNLENVISKLKRINYSMFGEIDPDKLEKMYKSTNTPMGIFDHKYTFTNRTDPSDPKIYEGRLFRIAKKLMKDPNYRLNPDEELGVSDAMKKVEDFDSSSPSNVRDAFNDFIVRDIQTIATKKAMLNVVKYVKDKTLLGTYQQPGFVSQKLMNIAKLESSITTMRKDIYKTGNQADRDKLTNEMTARETGLSREYNELINKLTEASDPHLNDWVGLHFIGSVWRKGSPFHDVNLKWGIDRWIGSDLFDRYSKVIDYHYNSILKDKIAKPTQTPVQAPVVSTSGTASTSPAAPAGPVPIDSNQVESELAKKKRLFSKYLDLTKTLPVHPLAMREGNKAKRALADLAAASNGIVEPFQFIKNVLWRPSLKYYNFDQYPLNKEEASILFKEAYKAKQNLETWRKTGDKNPFIRTLFSWSTPETLVRAVPETFEWYKKTSNASIKAEDRLNIHQADIAELVNASKELGDMTRAGHMVYDMHVAGKSEAYMRQVHGMNDYEFQKLKNNIIPKFEQTMNELHKILSVGVGYNRLNVRNELVKKNFSTGAIAKIMSKVTLGKIDKYFPRYVQGLDDIITAKAEKFVEDIQNGVVDIETLNTEGQFMHTRARSGSDIPPEYNIEKVLNTYIPKVILWTRNQELKYNNTKMLQKLSAKRIASKDMPMFDELVKYHIKMAQDITKPMDQNLGDNVTRFLLGLSFTRNIGLKVSSAIRNGFQKLAAFVNAGVHNSVTYHSFKENFQYQTKDGKILKGEDILNDAARKAGLRFTQVEGETGEQFEYDSMRQRVNDLLLEKNGSKLDKAKAWTNDKAAEMANLMFKLSGQSAEGRIGKLKLVPGFASQLTFKGMENSNRNYSFKVGFHAKFKYWYDHIRSNVSKNDMSDADVVDLASSMSMRGGIDLNNLTQFDYHKYNTPEIMRHTGLKGNSLRLLLQFKRYSIGLYRMYKEMITDSMAEYKYSPDNKLLNEATGKVASMMATHAAIYGIGSFMALNLYNMVQDDTGKAIYDLFQWIYGKAAGKSSKWEKDNLSYWAAKDTPIPYQLGPTIGGLASAGLMGLGLNDMTSKEWLNNYVYPRGPKAMIKAGQMASKGNADAFLYLAGIQRDWEASKKRRKKR